MHIYLHQYLVCWYIYSIYGKHSKISNHFLVLFSNKMLAVKAGIHKEIVKQGRP